MSTETETGPDEPRAAAKIVQPEHAHHQRELEWEGEQHVYEPHANGLPPIGPYVSELWRRREFAYELSRTKLQSQHFDTVFGSSGSSSTRCCWRSSTSCSWTSCAAG